LARSGENDHFRTKPDAPAISEKELEMTAINLKSAVLAVAISFGLISGTVLVVTPAAQAASAASAIVTLA
jgi:hypothetical protein